MMKINKVIARIKVEQKTFIVTTLYANKKIYLKEFSDLNARNDSNSFLVLSKTFHSQYFFCFSV